MNKPNILDEISHLRSVYYSEHHERPTAVVVTKDKYHELQKAMGVGRKVKLHQALGMNVEIELNGEGLLKVRG